MSLEPRQALSAALRDSSPWVRIGAARAAQELAPAAARTLLTKRATELSDPLPVDETATLAVALAFAGGETAPLVARLLKTDIARVHEALQGGANRWPHFLNETIDANKLSGPFRVLARYLVAWHVGQQAAQPAPEADAPTVTTGEEIRARNALYQFDHWQFLVSAGDQAMSSLAQRTFASALEPLRAGNATGAVASLVDIALTAAEPWMRIIAQNTIPAIGPDAAVPLIAALVGKPGPRPRAEVYESIAREAYEVEYRGLTPDNLATFLAGEALENFSDPATAFAIVGAAIAWQGEARARAARVAARMSADVALPALAWSALNLPLASERRIALNLLERIVGRDEAFGIRFHRVGSTELLPGKLDWLVERVKATAAVQTWEDDPAVAVPILAEAIAALPDIVGEAGYVYSTPPTAVRASGFAGSISNLLNVFGKTSELPETAAVRYPEAKFPATCRHGTDQVLTVRLLPTPVSEAISSGFDVPFGHGKTETELMVLVQAPGFTVSPSYAPLRVPRDGPSDAVHFRLRAEAHGQQCIDIKFMLGTAAIGQFCVVTTVTAAADTTAGRTEEVVAGNAPMTLLDPIASEAGELHSAAQAVLQVTTEADGHLAWTLFQPNAAPQSLGKSPAAIGLQAASAWIKDQAALVRQFLEKDLSDADLAGVFAQLSGLGYGLYAQIAPPPLTAVLKGLQENALVVVDSDADWVPWELLATHPAEKLWAERFVLVRAPVATTPPNAIVAPPQTLPNNLGRALIVVGDEIDRPRRLGERTFGGMAERAEPLLIEADWLTLCENLTGKDIVHFICHGRSENKYHLSFGPGVGSRLRPEQVHALRLKWGAVVFANACSSGTTDVLLAEFQSFGREFYFAGARPFIGTLGPVPERESVDFAAMFYKHFAFAGLPAGQALRLAKRDAARAFKKPIWLFYCLYGSPSAVRRWSVA